MNVRQKLAIITTWYPPINGEFVENYARDFVEEYDVQVFVAFPSLKNKVVTTVENGVTVNRIYFRHLPRKAQWMMNQWIEGFAKRILLITKDLDLIHAHNYYGGFVAEKVANALGKPFVVTLHSDSIMKGTLNSAQEKTLSMMLPKADTVTTVGYDLQRVVEEQYGVQPILIPNYVDTDKFIIKNKAVRPFRFVMVGYLDDNKGIELVIEAFGKLGNPDAELHIIGADISDTSHNVVSHGKQPNESVARIMADSHVVISFSKQETFGISLIEGMSCGLPVLYCKSGGPEKFVPNWASIQVARTVEDLHKGMQKMIKEYDRYDASEIRAYIVEHYDVRIIKTMMIDIYKA